MKANLQGTLAKTFAAVALVLAGCGGGDDTQDFPPSSFPSTVVAPQPLPGPFPVACSNVEQDFTRVPAGRDVDGYWEGKPASDGSARYATDLLVDPADTLSVTVTAPNDGGLYGSFAGKPVVVVVIACYPTGPSNTRPGYALPTGGIVPRMQTGDAAPLFADATARYPLLAYSHGYGGSPLSGDYLATLSWFASNGYVVVAPFHGDPRISNLKIEDFDDAIDVLSHFDNYVALQALRPKEMSAALDLVIGHPQYRDHVDPTKIGGFGASFGGETMMLMGGAGLTTSVGQSWTVVGADPRLKAAVGYVPYFGQPFLPAFGRDQHGLDNVTLPYLAIAGTADTTAPLHMTELGLDRVAGRRELVSLNGVEHGLDDASTNDIFTWSITFLDAEVRGDPAARQRLATMASVAGGGDDRVVIPYNGPGGQ